jgi:hypothetical protein
MIGGGSGIDSALILISMLVFVAVRRKRRDI